MDNNVVKTCVSCNTGKHFENFIKILRNVNRVLLKGL